MECPHCHKEIENSVVAKCFAVIGGKKSKRIITPEQQYKMQSARLAKKADGEMWETGAD